MDYKNLYEKIKNNVVKLEKSVDKKDKLFEKMIISEALTSNLNLGIVQLYSYAVCLIDEISKICLSNKTNFDYNNFLIDKISYEVLDKTYYNGHFLDLNAIRISLAYYNQASSFKNDNEFIDKLISYYSFEPNQQQLFSNKDLKLKAFFKDLFSQIESTKKLVDLEKRISRNILNYIKIFNQKEVLLNNKLIAGQMVAFFNLKAKTISCYDTSFLYSSLQHQKEYEQLNNLVLNQDFNDDNIQTIVKNFILICNHWYKTNIEILNYFAENSLRTISYFLQKMDLDYIRISSENDLYERFFSIGYFDQYDLEIFYAKPVSEVEKMAKELIKDNVIRKVCNFNNTIFYTFVWIDEFFKNIMNGFDKTISENLTRKNWEKVKHFFEDKSKGTS